MCAYRRHNAQNGEIPLTGHGKDLPVPEGRIEMGPPPEIDIANDQLGTLFTERRRTLGMKVEEVAEDIKIKPEYLRAIEREEFENLPTPEYARLFIRAYAERLGFNATEVYALLDINMPGWSVAAMPKHAAPALESTALSGPLPGTTATAPPDSKRHPSGARLIVGVVVAIIALSLIAWYVIGMNRDEETGDIAAPPTTSQASIGGDVVLPAASDPQSEEANVVDSATAAHGGQSDWESLHLVMHFSEETWASLQADGDNVANSIFAAGSELEATGSQSFRLSLGHTVGITTTVNGRTLRPFREWADRLEGHLINRDSIRVWLDTAAAAVGSPSTYVEFIGPRES